MSPYPFRANARPNSSAKNRSAAAGQTSGPFDPIDGALILDEVSRFADLNLHLRSQETRCGPRRRPSAAGDSLAWHRRIEYRHA
jgi:hypothetical protein